MKQLIINADDLGICESANRAILQGFVEGVLTSTSLMAIGPAYEHALESVVKPLPELGIGLHLCLTSGRCCAPPGKIPTLSDDQSRLRLGFVGLYRLAKTTDGRRQIEQEVDSQFQRIEASGVKIDHVNSHRHVHMIPEIFEIVTKLAQQHGCPAIRVSREFFERRFNLAHPRQMIGTLSNLPKQLILGRFAGLTPAHQHSLVSCDRVFGILGSGNMNAIAMKAVISAMSDGVSEVITHPGEAVNILNDELTAGDRSFWKSDSRHEELQTLLDPSLKSWLNSNDVALKTYADIVPRSEETGHIDACAQPKLGRQGISDTHPE